MTRDDITRWAREAGWLTWQDAPAAAEFIERFAALAYAAGAAAEREACAKVCEGQYPYSVMHADQRAATNCADAIRARGQA